MIVLDPIMKNIDIGLWDETHYLKDGLNIPGRGFQNVAYAPGYQLWYLFLSFFTKSRIELYFLNTWLLSILPLVSLFLLLTAVSKRPILSMFVSSVLLLSEANLSLWPKIGSFTLFFISTGILLSYLIIKPILRVLFLITVATFTYFLRPEYLLTVILLEGFLFFQIISSSLQVGYKALFGSLSLLLFFLTAYTSYSNLSSARGKIAFQQHFARNYVEWHGLDLYPYSDSTKVMTIATGKPIGLTEMAQERPYLLLQHFYQNILNIPEALNRFFASTTHVFFLFIVFAFCARASQRNRLSTGYTDFAYLLTFIAPGVLACIIIYPNISYLISSLPLGIVALIMLTLRSNTVVSSKKKVLSFQLLFCFTVILSAFFLAKTSNKFIPDWLLGRKNLKAVIALEQLPLKKGLTYFSIAGSFHVYTDPTGYSIFAQDREGGWREYLNANKPDIIILSDELKHNYRYRNDQDWHRFAQEPESYGFNYVDVPESDRDLLIHQRAYSE